ncbi:LOW QUALITY PROTEIN: hypothetical protein V2J09_018628 [Rumex salicifolius]
MDWLTIAFSIAVLLISSFCKIFWASFSQSKAICFPGGEQKKNVLLVIAHPDDESMFFAPSINYLTSRGHNIHILCLSTGMPDHLIPIDCPTIGNADGIGKIRTIELYKASAVLKVPMQQVKVVDHQDLQDGFGKVWNLSLIAKFVEEEVISHSIDLIVVSVHNQLYISVLILRHYNVLTFDGYGVSGHCNHRDVHAGVRKLLLDYQGKIEAWELTSSNILRKYSGVLDVWLSGIYTMHHRSENICFILNEHPLISVRAMAQHMSQWVWILEEIDASTVDSRFHHNVSQAFCVILELYIYEHRSEDEDIG